MSVPCSYKEYCKRQGRWRICHLKSDATLGQEDPNPLCPHHRAAVSTTAAEGLQQPKLRVVCPYNSQHTVAFDKLRQHIKKCPSYLQEIQSAIEDDQDEHPLISAHAPTPSLQSLPTELVQRVIAIVEAASRSLQPPRVAANLHGSFSELYGTLGKHKQKHVIQESYIIENMRSFGLLDVEPVQIGARTILRSPIYLEVGAGTAGLSRHLQLAILSSQRESRGSTANQEGEREGEEGRKDVITRHVLLDRLHFRSRRQRDYLLKQAGGSVVRLHKDMAVMSAQDLDQFMVELRQVGSTDCGLSEVSESRTESTRDHLVCFSKHFCGEATDLALNWLASIHRERGYELSLSVCMATCCHSLCQWESYVNRDFMTSLGIDSAEKFVVLAKLSNWATLDLTGTDTTSDPAVDMNQDRTRRKQLGILCKQLLDHGRIKFLQASVGLDGLVEYIQYCESERTPENCLILATNLAMTNC